MRSAHTSRTESPTRTELCRQKGTSCSHLIRCLLLIVTLETTWKLQEIILLLTCYSLLVNRSLHNSPEQGRHSNIDKEPVPLARAEAGQQLNGAMKGLNTEELGRMENESHI